MVDFLSKAAPLRVLQRLSCQLTCPAAVSVHSVVWVERTIEERRRVHLSALRLFGGPGPGTIVPSGPVDVPVATWRE